MASVPPTSSASLPPSWPAARFEALRLRVARAAWIAVVPLSLVAFAAALPARYDELRAEAVHFRLMLANMRPATLPPPVGAWLSSQLYAPAMLALEILVMLVCASTAVLLFWRRHDERMAIIASVSLVTYGVLFLPPLDALAAAHPAWSLLVHGVQALGVESSLLLFYISPDGHFVPRWTRPLAILWTLWTVAGLIAPASPFNIANGRLHVTSPSGFPLPWLLLSMMWWSSGILAQAVRYRHVSTPQQRQQTKWVLVGWTVVIVFYTALALPRVVFPGLSAPGPVDLLYLGLGVPSFEAVLLLAPIPITISMLRYRLWDVDVVINRALVYGFVTLALGLVYVVSIVALGTIFRSASGQDSPLAVALSTLACAWLFQPVHRHIQRGVDRRFYRHKYDAARLIEEFGKGVRSEVELGALLDDLMAVVQQSTEPAHISAVLLPVRPAPRQHQRPTQTEPSVEATRPEAHPHETIRAETLLGAGVSMRRGL